MHFFLWYMDEVLSESTKKQVNFNAFSFYFYMGSGQTSASRPRSPIYIKEEASPQTHFNVYMEGDRWDIVPVGRIMTC